MQGAIRGKRVMFVVKQAGVRDAAAAAPGARLAGLLLAQLDLLAPQAIGGGVGPHLNDAAKGKEASERGVR